MYQVESDVEKNNIADDRYIIIFDGVCNFCNDSVNFIINRDKNGKFAFVATQTDLAHRLIEKYRIKDVGFDTFVLIKNGQYYLRTNAAFEITKNLSGLWYLIRVLKIIPRPIRDYFYRLLARNRYKLFGKKDQCMVPDDSVKKRFLK